MTDIIAYAFAAINAVLFMVTVVGFATRPFTGPLDHLIPPTSDQAVD